LLLCLCIIIIVYNNSKASSCIELTKNNKMFDNFEILRESSDTLCSERATKHGLHQRVIGVSSYRSNKDNILLTDKIWLYTLKYISEAEHFYPDWRVRVYYHNLNITINEILEIEKRFKNVDFCNVFNIPLLGNISSYMSGRLHRFIAIADRFVDIYMSRDIDSPILEREVVSVNEWILSNKLYHIMRDHPLHNDVILAGLWAVKISKNQTIRNELIRRLFSKSIMNCYNPINGDEHFLQHYVWPIAQKDSIQHDSFHCQLFNLSIPFTKPKLSMSQFVGCRRPCRPDQDPPGPCPIRCRLPNNTDENLC